MHITEEQFHKMINYLEEHANELGATFHTKIMKSYLKSNDECKVYMLAFKTTAHNSDILRVGYHDMSDNDYHIYEKFKNKYSELMEIIK